MDTLIVAIVSFVAGGALTGLVYHIIEMRIRIKALETAQAKHLPYRTAEEIEDATAAILTAKFKNEYHGELLDNALAHLQMARSGRAKNLNTKGTKEREGA